MPFTQISGQCSKFVDKQYIVWGLGIQDPNSFQKGELLAFILHIRSRQEAHGIEDAFHWKNVADAGGELELAHYGYNAKAAKTKQASAHQKARRQARKRTMTMTAVANQLDQLDGLLPMPDSRSNSPSGSRAPMQGNNDVQDDAPAAPAIHRNNPPASTVRAMDPNIDPQIQDMADDQPGNSSPEPETFPLKCITELEYQRIRRTVPQLIIPPINGPNDGPPEYQILPTLWDEYQENLAKGLYDEDPPAMSQKHPRRQEDLMIEEAHKFMGPNPTKRSRAAKALAHQEAAQEKAMTTCKSTCRKK